jgi:hypothetical protein
VRRTEDPLAELARLIGQEDPFADFVAHRPADSRASGNPGIQRRTRAPEGRGYDGRPAERIERRRPLPARAPEPSVEDETTRDLPEPPRTNGRGAYAYGGARPTHAEQPQPPHGHHAEEARPARAPLPRAEARAVEPYHEHERPARPEPRPSRRAPARAETEAPAYEQYSAADYDPDYDDEAYLPAHGDEFYEEAPRRRVKAWMVAGIAAVAVFALGASGLFAYRAIFGVTNTAMPPVTIKPEAGPTKVVPGAGAKSAEAGGNKQIYDRVGADSPSSGERIVSREERPIETNAPATRMPAGTVAPVTAGTSATGPAQASPVPSAPAAAMTPAAVSTEPRRVRTVTVRADGSVVSDPARASAPAAAQPSSPAPRAAPTSVSNAPLALSGAQQPSTPAAPPARPAASAPAQSDNPWATVTTSGQLSAPAPGSQAAVNPQQLASPSPAANPAPIVAVQQPAPAGSYVVQVAAQKTEAEAAASWQQLQQRYSAVLGGQQATIRRVDLGERGVFYRAQVGPFASRSQASEVCQSLKAAGGECVIQRN